MSAEGVARRMPRPRHALLGFEDRDLGLGAAFDRDEVGEPKLPTPPLTEGRAPPSPGGGGLGSCASDAGAGVEWPAAQIEQTSTPSRSALRLDLPPPGGGGRRARRPPAAPARRAARRGRRPSPRGRSSSGRGARVLQPREAEGEEVAALAGDQRVQFVEDHRVEIGEETPGVGRREEERRLLRRGEEDVRRRELLALALVEGRVAGPRLEPDRASPISATGCSRFRAMSTASAFSGET